MKYIICLALLLASCKSGPPEPAEDIRTAGIQYPFEYSADQSFHTISAHRSGGDIPGHPENCIESMQYIVDRVDAAWMEVDIRRTKDNDLVLMHDASLERTTTGHGRVGDHTLKEIEELFLLDNHGRVTTFHPPSFEDVLKWNASKGHTVLTLDIKEDVSYRDIVEKVKKYDQMTQVVGIVYNLDQARALRRVSDDIVISLPVRNEEEWMRLKHSDLVLDKLIAFTGTIRSPESLYEDLHAAGILTIFGTIGNIDRQAEARGFHIYDDLYEAGADILSTDRPLVFDR